ncbi:isoaspartyl peptidase/L-asparaginase family protein [Lyngbya confervoides]|uniref:Isoaspartyl peptidase/L-asparaginase family protein n=1 Tax=Lyngbya confervoides BDU141951 TaxID=1574623 RepID=A0ABD4T7N1_9CYAN|nr:isoaspartyl peptidase/L-asparaginase family protein [Lyngbya confervoides]MCM1984297.1 isoaspartyl peptidase/L-asparaginase family protein [Lyngbya confervoides BDU141951]
MSQSYSLMIHGGAGALEDMQKEASLSDFEASITAILEQGRQRLDQGEAALDVVEFCVMCLEDDPLYNAGRGSVLNAQGQVEMDAALMSGDDLRAGGVACISQIKNPIALARRVLDHGDHVLLVGDGALDFAKFCGMEQYPQDYFLTALRVQQLQEAQAAGRVTLDHERIKPSQKLGTVGAVAQDLSGNLAAATSTGGLVNKRWGRVGDTPIVGAGVFADNQTCAVSATGYGEQFLRTVFAKTVSDLVQFQQLDAARAAQAGIDYLVAKVQGDGGVIVIDRAGRCGAAQSTSGLIHGWIEHGGPTHCQMG